MRLTKEREAELRHYYGGTIPVSYYRPTMVDEYAVADVADLLAELDAVRAELDEWKTHLIAEDERLLLTESVVVMERQLTRACAERDAARADERAKVVEWLREHVEERCAAFAADAIERGEHVPEAQR